MVVDFYVHTYFSGSYKYEDTQDPICARITTGYLIDFTNVNIPNM